jgi:hypothetical protein
LIHQAAKPRIRLERSEVAEKLLQKIDSMCHEHKILLGAQPVSAYMHCSIALNPSEDQLQGWTGRVFACLSRNSPNGTLTQAVIEFERKQLGLVVGKGPHIESLQLIIWDHVDILRQTTVANLVKLVVGEHVSVNAIYLLDTLSLNRAKAYTDDAVRRCEENLFTAKHITC